MNGLGTTHIETYMTEPKSSLRNVIMALYNEKELLCVGMEALCFGLDASLLQGMDGTWFPMNEELDNATPQPLAFGSKSSRSTETHYSNIEIEALGIMMAYKKFITTALPMNSAKL